MALHDTPRSQWDGKRGKPAHNGRCVGAPSFCLPNKVATKDFGMQSLLSRTLAVQAAHTPELNENFFLSAACCPKSATSGLRRMLAENIVRTLA